MKASSCLFIKAILHSNFFWSFSTPKIMTRKLYIQPLDISQRLWYRLLNINSRVRIICRRLLIWKKQRARDVISCRFYHNQLLIKFWNIAIIDPSTNFSQLLYWLDLNNLRLLKFQINQFKNFLSIARFLAYFPNSITLGNSSNPNCNSHTYRNPQIY